MLYRIVVSLPEAAKDLLTTCDRSTSEIVRAALVQYLDLDPLTWKKRHCVEVISDRHTPSAHVAPVIAAPKPAPAPQAPSPVNPINVLDAVPEDEIDFGDE